jgi:hypothetical protein
VLYDPTLLVQAHREDLLQEAERERLATLARPHASTVRQHMAAACNRVADWLDEPTRYDSPAESGHSDWVNRSACA